MQAPPMHYPAPPALSGGYTLPPTAAYFPVTTYTNNTALDKPQLESSMMPQECSHDQPQPNTPDLLMHRRQVIRVLSNELERISS